MHGKMVRNISRDTRWKRSGQWLESDDVEREDPDRQYFDQVVIDGGTFVYHQYPLNANHEDEDFEIENSTISSDTNLKTDH